VVVKTCEGSAVIAPHQISEERLPGGLALLRTARWKWTCDSFCRRKLDGLIEDMPRMSDGCRHAEAYQLLVAELSLELLHRSSGTSWRAIPSERHTAKY